MEIEVNGVSLWGGNMDFEHHGIYVKKFDANNLLCNPLDDNPPLEPSWLRSKFHPVYYTIGWKYVKDGKTWGDWVCIPEELLPLLIEQLKNLDTPQQTP